MTDLATIVRATRASAAALKTMQQCGREIEAALAERARLILDRSYPIRARGRTVWVQERVGYLTAQIGVLDIKRAAAKRRYDRAWHDHYHLALGARFDLDGEIEAVKLQLRQLFTLYGDNARSRRWADILAIEVVRQAEWHMATGAFPIDQANFTESCLAHMSGNASWARVNLVDLVDDAAKAASMAGTKH